MDVRDIKTAYGNFTRNKTAQQRKHQSAAASRKQLFIENEEESYLIKIFGRPVSSPRKLRKKLKHPSKFLGVQSTTTSTRVNTVSLMNPRTMETEPTPQSQTLSRLHTQMPVTPTKQIFHKKSISMQANTISFLQNTDGFQDMLREMLRQKFYHKNFMQLMSRKMIEKYPKKMIDLREVAKAQKFYKQFPFQESHENPTYLTADSAFYSRSRRRCLRQKPIDIEIKRRQRERNDNLDAKQEQCLSYMQYLTDSNSKKKFQKASKRKYVDQPTLQKAKEKILTIWKSGTQSRTIVRQFIDKVIEDRRKNRRI